MRVHVRVKTEKRARTPHPPARGDLLGFARCLYGLYASCSRPRCFAGQALQLLPSLLGSLLVYLYLQGGVSL